MRIYDIIVIGTGVSGITIAKLLNSDADILLIEKGKNIKSRRHLLYGWFGSSLHTMHNLKTKSKDGYQKIADNFNISYKLNEKQRFQFASDLYSDLIKGSDIIFNTEVMKLSKKNDLFNVGIAGGVFHSKVCVLATGHDISLVKDSQINNSKIYLGFRIEIPTRQIKNRLKVKNFIYNGIIGEREIYGVTSSFAYFDKKKKSGKSSFFIGVEMDFPEAIRCVKIINILNGDRIKKERVDTILSGKSYLKELPFYSELQDKLAEICKDNISFISSGICYSPEVYGQGIVKSDKEQKLFCVGRCSSAITSADSIVSSIDTVGSIKEEI